MMANPGCLWTPLWSNIRSRGDGLREEQEESRIISTYQRSHAVRGSAALSLKVLTLWACRAVRHLSRRPDAALPMAGDYT